MPVYSHRITDLSEIGIEVKHESGAIDLYAPSANTDVARGVALLAAVSASEAGDVIKLGPGSFDIVTGVIALPANVSMIGVGPQATEIKSQTISPGSGNGTIVQPGDNAYIGYLTITANAALGNPQLPIGAYKSTAQGAVQSAATNVILDHVETLGESDGLFFDHEDAPTMAWRCYDCVFASQYDGVSIQRNGVTLELYNCSLTAAGPSTYGSGTIARALQMNGPSGGSIARLFNCRLSASGASSTNSAIECNDGSASLHIEAYGCKFFSSGTNAKDITLSGVGSTARMKIGASLYDPSKVTGLTKLTVTDGTEANTASTLVKRDSSGNFSAGTITANLIGGVVANIQALSGAGAVDITTLTSALTSTGGGQALTLANGTAGQIKTIVHDVDGGSMVLTPTTNTGFSTITFTNAGDTVTLQYLTTRGWMVIASYGVTIAP